MGRADDQPNCWSGGRGIIFGQVLEELHWMKEKERSVIRKIRTTDRMGKEAKMKHLIESSSRVTSRGSGMICAGICENRPTYRQLVKQYERRKI